MRSARHSVHTFKSSTMSSMDPILSRDAESESPKESRPLAKILSSSLLNGPSLDNDATTSSTIATRPSSSESSERTGAQSQSGRTRGTVQFLVARY